MSRSVFSCHWYHYGRYKKPAPKWLRNRQGASFYTKEINSTAGTKVNISRTSAYVRHASTRAPLWSI